MTGNELRDIRKQLNFSQQIMALKLGVSQQYLSGLENGRKSIRISMIDKIRKVAGLTTTPIGRANNTGELQVVDNKEDDDFSGCIYVADNNGDTAGEKMSRTSYPSSIKTRREWEAWWWRKLHQRCLRCSNPCKQSSRIILVYCPQFNGVENAIHGL